MLLCAGDCCMRLVEVSKMITRVIISKAAGSQIWGKVIILLTTKPETTALTSPLTMWMVC